MNNCITIPQCLMPIESVRYIRQQMNTSNSFDQDNQARSIFQNGYMQHVRSVRQSHNSRDIGHQPQLKRVSPMPQERLNHAIYPSSTIVPFQLNDYQLPLRVQQPTSIIDSRTLQDLLLRVQKLELRGERFNQYEFKVDKLETFINNMKNKDSKDVRSEQNLRGKENSLNYQNQSKNDDDFKNRIKDMITREELQRQLIGLDSAFKTLLKDLRTATNTEIRDIHTKQKKALIEIVASQISEKIQNFKQNHFTEISNRIQKVVQNSLSKQFITKNLIGLSKQKFMGDAIPLKLNQDLTYLSNGVFKTIATASTIYHIDSQGFLLDSGLFYLLDKNNSRIKLSDIQLDLLRKQGLLPKISNKESIR